MTDDRLNALFAKHDAAEAERQHEADRRAEEERLQVLKAERALGLWQQASKALDNELASLNEALGSRGLRLTRGATDKRDTPALDHFSIYFNKDGATGGRVMGVNVSKYGHVSLPMASKQTYPVRTEKLELPVDEKAWRGALLTFLEINTPL